MMSRKILKTLFIPSAVLVTEEKIQQNDQKKSLLCRPSELPIYVPEPAPLAEEKKYNVPNSIENGFATVREQVTKVYKEVKAYQRVATEYIDQSKDNAEWLIKYLRQEDNTTPKAGAIAIGGLTGLIFGLRGRFFKRTLYAATGALGMAAVCYPKEASQYSRVAIVEARKYATIAYNFAYGGGETEKQVKDHELTDISEKDAVTVITEMHKSTSDTCDCPIGNFDGHHINANTS